MLEELQNTFFTDVMISNPGDPKVHATVLLSLHLSSMSASKVTRD